MPLHKEFIRKKKRKEKKKHGPTKPMIKLHHTSRKKPYYEKKTPMISFTEIISYFELYIPY